MLRTTSRYALSIAVVAAVGCGQSRETVKVRRQPSAPSAPTATADTPASRQVHYDASLATYVKDKLDECVDVAVDVTVAAGAVADAKPGANPADAVVEEMRKAKEPGRTTTKLAERCEVRFPNRQELARCEVPLPPAKDKPGVTTEVTIDAYHYDFAMVGVDDSRMRECLSMKGRWSTLPSNSDAWILAKHEHSKGTPRRRLATSDKR